MAENREPGHQHRGYKRRKPILQIEYSFAYQYQRDSILKYIVKTNKQTNKQMTAEISFDVPNGAAAKVHIIDSGFRLSGMPTNFLLSPEMKGFDELPALGSWSFLVESSTGRKVLFDLGGPSDVNSFPPSVAAVIEEVGVAVKGTTSVAELLMANGVELSDIESVVWRYEPSINIVYLDFN